MSYVSDRESDHSANFHCEVVALFFQIFINDGLRTLMRIVNMSKRRYVDPRNGEIIVVTELLCVSEFRRPEI